MADQVQIRRNTTSGLGSFVAAQGELIMDTTKNSLFLGNGSSQPGAYIGGTQISQYGTLIGEPIIAEYAGSAGETITTGGLSFTSSVTIPAGWVQIIAAAWLIKTTITGPTGNLELGYTGNPGTLISPYGYSLTSGSSTMGTVGPKTIYNGSAANLILTSSAGNFTGGAIRLSIIYVQLSPPTS